MSGKLRCYSFHSVKGGVGKSVLSTLTAMSEAATGTATYLVDMDLTGTSLADVLHLQAPEFPSDAKGVLSLREASTGLLDDRKMADALGQRQSASPSEGAVGLPFLNDFLLFAPPERDPEDDLDPKSISWDLAGATEKLQVLPSSALPRDLERMLPVVFDEERGAFLEARLEVLLEALLQDKGDVAVVFDTPPTIPGLSRAVMSLAIRLGQPGEKHSLAEDGILSQRLRDAEIDWRSFLVSSMDVQDQRAASRWLALLGENERGVVQWLINRAPADDTGRDAKLREAVTGLRRPDQAAGPLQASAGLLDDEVFKSIVWIDENETLRTGFQIGGSLAAPSEWLRNLRAAR